MYLAPLPLLSGVVVPLAEGMGGVRQTVSAMRALVKQYRVDLNMRQIATSALFPVPARDRLSEANAIYCRVRDWIRYTPDIFEVETLSSPDKTWQGRIGDCDDIATLLATLFETVGFATRFIVAGYSASRAPEHVYLQVLVDGDWINADASEQQPFGWMPPNPTCLFLERV